MSKELTAAQSAWAHARMVEHVLSFVLRAHVSQMPEEAAASFIHDLAVSAPLGDGSEITGAISERIAELLGTFCSRLDQGQRALRAGYQRPSTDRS